MSRLDWNLLVVASANGEFLTPIQLQKSLFLIGQNLRSIIGEDFYDFKPYNYGPFDKHVYLDADLLRDRGLMKIQSAGDNSWSEYATTDEGSAKAVEIKQDIDDVIVQYIDSVVSWVRKLSFAELVSEIYEAYPDMAQNTIFGSQE